MKKSYHSMVVPMVDAMTALRRCALCSDADSVSYVAAMVIGIFLQPIPRPLGTDSAVSRTKINLAGMPFQTSSCGQSARVVSRLLPKLAAVREGKIRRLDRHPAGLGGL